MARPRKDAAGPGAKERIVDAFWQLISVKPYADVTIRGLCAEAGVNPNTFYRHFTCMDDLAEKAFEENMVDGFPRLLMGLVRVWDESDGANDAEGRVAKGKANPSSEASGAKGAIARFSRMRLFAQNGSETLMGILRREWLGAWLSEAGKTPEDLAREQRIDLLMIAGAEMALAGLSDDVCGLDDIVGILDRPLGKALLATIEDIAAQ